METTGADAVLPLYIIMYKLEAEAMFFDTHAHYDDERFDGDRESLLASLPEKGVGRIVNCGSDAASSIRSAEFAHKYEIGRAHV